MRLTSSANVNLLWLLCGVVRTTDVVYKYDHRNVVLIIFAEGRVTGFGKDQVFTAVYVVSHTLEHYLEIRLPSATCHYDGRELVMPIWHQFPLSFEC
jgi:hypothetical protein